MAYFRCGRKALFYKGFSWVNSDRFPWHWDYTATFKRPIEKWTKKLGEKLGENEVKIIELMKENKYITAKELSGHIKISTTAIDKNISKLKKKGILKRIGPAKGGYWEVIKKWPFSHSLPLEGED